MRLVRARLVALVMLLALLSPLISTQPASAFAGCPCSIFTGQTPSNLDNGTDKYKLGLAFHSDTYGYVTGVRFYKDALNTGTHIGQLYSVADSTHHSLVAAMTFANETSSGWQTATFDNPVLIRPNQQYVVAYTTPSGKYSYTPNAFTTEDSK